MTDKDGKDAAKDDDAAEKEQELRDEQPRVTSREADARETAAAEEQREVIGLRDLQAKARAYLNRFKEADLAEQERIRIDFEESRRKFVSRLDALNSSPTRIDQMREDRLNAQLDQLDAEIVELDAKVQEKAIVLDTEQAAEIERVHQELAEAQEKRRQVATARKESLEQVKSAFEQTIDHLKHTWQHARERVEAARHA